MKDAPSPRTLEEFRYWLQLGVKYYEKAQLGEIEKLSHSSTSSYTAPQIANLVTYWTASAEALKFALEFLDGKHTNHWQERERYYE